MESIVVDTNKVLAAFIRHGIVHNLLFSGKFKPAGPQKLMEEVRKHKGYIAEKSGMESGEVGLAIEMLEVDFDISKKKEYSDKKVEGRKIAPHEEDTEFFALALKSGFPIWSNEEAFRKQSKVKIFSTKELAEYLGMQ